MYKELYQKMRTEFATNLKNIRKQNGLTQDEVAKNAHIARPTYISYEQGHTIPDAITLKLIAETFNVSIDEILGHKIDITKTNKRKAWWDEI